MLPGEHTLRVWLRGGLKWLHSETLNLKRYFWSGEVFISQRVGEEQILCLVFPRNVRSSGELIEEDPDDQKLIQGQAKNGLLFFMGQSNQKAFRLNKNSIRNWLSNVWVLVGYRFKGFFQG